MKLLKENEKDMIMDDLMENRDDYEDLSDRDFVDMINWIVFADYTANFFS